MAGVQTPQKSGSHFRTSAASSLSRKSLEQSPILLLTIVVHQGKTEMLPIYSSDIPATVARRFSKRHGLSSRAEALLLKQIEQEIAQLMAEEQARTDFCLKKNRRPTTSQVVTEPTFRSTLFGKLYYQAYPSEEQEPVQNTVSRVIPAPPANANERLYREGMVHKERQIRERTLLKSRQEDVDADCSFKPAINQVSERLAMKHYADSQQELRRIKNYQAQVSERRLNEEAACTFTPKINRWSKSMVEKNEHASHFESLYQDAQHRLSRQQIVRSYFHENQFSFKPQLNRTASESRASVKERLYRSQSTAPRDSVELVDPVTGQEFFKPRLHRPRRTREISPHSARCTYSNRVTFSLDGKNKSELLLSKAKLRAYTDLFERLGPNQEGCLVPGHLSTKQIHKEKLSALRPVLEQIEDGGEQVDYRGFADAMEDLMQHVTPQARQALLFKQNSDGLSEPPKQKRQRPVIDKDIFQRGLEKRLQTLQKIEAEREKLVMCELYGCTFKPQTTKYRKPIGV